MADRFKPGQRVRAKRDFEAWREMQAGDQLYKMKAADIRQGQQAIVTGHLGDKTIFNILDYCLVVPLLEDEWEAVESVPTPVERHRGLPKIAILKGASQAPIHMCSSPEEVKELYGWHMSPESFKGVPTYICPLRPSQCPKCGKVTAVTDDGRHWDDFETEHSCVK